MLSLGPAVGLTPVVFSVQVSEWQASVDVKVWVTRVEQGVPFKVVQVIQVETLSPGLVLAVELPERVPEAVTVEESGVVTGEVSEGAAVIDPVGVSVIDPVSVTDPVVTDPVSVTDPVEVSVADSVEVSVADSVEVSVIDSVEVSVGDSVGQAVGKKPLGQSLGQVVGNQVG